METSSKFEDNYKCINSKHVYTQTHIANTRAMNNKHDNTNLNPITRETKAGGLL